MVNFLSPDIIVRERATAAVAVRLESPSIVAMQGTAQRGPINRPQRVRSPDDWASIYGLDDGGDSLESIVGHFANGGVEVIFNRVGGYTDINDPATLTAVAAETTLNTAGTAATGAQKTSSNTETFDLSQAALGASPATLTCSVDGGGPDTATLDVTPSVLTAAGVPGGVGTLNDTLVFTVHGVTQTYTVPAAPPTTATEWALDIASQLPGVSGSVVGGAVVLTTDRKGSSADVSYVSATGTAGADSGFGAGPTAGVNAGPNEAVNDEEVTAAEIAAIITADWTSGGGATGSAVGGAVQVDTNATGAGASLGAITGTAATAVFGGAAAGVVTGTAAGAPTTATLKAIATSEGAHGNSLAVTTARRDRVVATITEDMAIGANDFMIVDSAAQLRVGLQVFLEDTVTTETQRAVIREIVGTKVFFETTLTLVAAITAANSPTVTKETFDLTTLEGDPLATFFDLSMSPLDVSFYFGNVIGVDPTLMDPRDRVYVEDQSVTPTVSVDPRPVDVTEQALTGGLDGSAVTSTDYIGSTISKLGLNAFDKFTDFSMLSIPGVETFDVQRAQLDYASGREDHVAFMDAPEGLTPDQVVTFKNVTANLFGTYGYYSVPRLQIRRKSNGQVEDFPQAGFVTGAFARVDQARNVAKAAAGITDGQIRGAIGVARDNEYEDKSNRDIVYPEGINPIYSREGRGILIWGQNTLDPGSDRGAIGVRRAFIFLRRAIENISEFVLFEQNTPTLRADFRKRVTAFLSVQRQNGVIQGDTDNEAFFIICDETNNGQAVVNARRFVARIGVNVLPGIDFALIEIERDTRALDQEIAA